MLGSGQGAVAPQSWLRGTAECPVPLSWLLPLNDCSNQTLPLSFRAVPYSQIRYSPGDKLFLPNVRSRIKP